MTDASSGRSSADRATLATLYAASLGRFVDTGKEDQLQEAYSLGRSAFSDDVSLLDLLHIHHQATEALVRRTRPRARADDVLAASFGFLSEALATFEMAQRGYWEAQERARRERAIAEMLQHNLLPAETPHIEGLDLAVRYLPGEANSHAGGDWYDVFTLDADRVGLVVGDVSGHGVTAAAAMGQLRIAVLAYALTTPAEPAWVVEQVDALLERLGTGQVATLIYVVASPADGTLRIVNAGHPPPLLVDPAQGEARPWRGGHGRLLGMPEGAPTTRHQDLDRLPPGGHLLLYTDGLIEPLEREEKDGVASLCAVTATFQGSADELCDHVLAELAPDGARDDICIVVATLPS